MKRVPSNFWEWISVTFVSTMVLIFGMTRMAQAGSANSEAVQAKLGYATGAAMNTKAAVEFYGECGGGWAIANCVLGTMSAAQAGFMVYSMVKTGGAVDDSTCEGMGTCNTPNGAVPSASNPSNGNGRNGDSLTATNRNANGGPGRGGDFSALKNKIDQLQAGFAEKGYTFDPNTNTVNTPKGPISLDGVSSPSDLASKGLDPKTLKDAEARLAALAREYQKMDIGSLEDDNSGGGYASRGSKNDSMKDYLDRLNQANRMPASDAPSAKGLTRYLGDQPIGVAQDNIFEMISRRYSAEQQKGIFIPADAR